MIVLEVSVVSVAIFPPVSVGAALQQHKEDEEETGGGIG